MENDLVPQNGGKNNEGLNNGSDGFGSIGPELELDKAAIEEAERAKKEEEAKRNASLIDGPVIATNEKAEKRARSYKRAKILAVIVLLLAIGCGVGAYFYLNQEDENKHDAQPAVSDVEQLNYRLDGNGLSDFDLKFMKIENNEKNMVYSPLSLKYALAMLRDGADAESREQIEDLIGDYELKKYVNSKNISLANAMFVRKSYKDNVLDSYIDGLKSDYGAEVVFDDFTSAKSLNNWVSDKTLGLIKNSVSDDDLKNLNFALVNALAIDQNWNYKLQCYGVYPSERGNVPCKGDDERYEVSYKHEKFSQSIESFGFDYEGLKFGDLEKRKAVKIAASFNNYNIIEEIGEDKIREKVTEEYKKWLKTENGEAAISQYENDRQSGDVDPSIVSTNVNNYMKELKENYGREDSSTDFYLNDTDEVKVFAKDLKKYDGNTLQYVGILPKNTKLKEFVADLSADKVAEYINGLKELRRENFEDGKVTSIEATIPLFRYDYNLSMIDGLKELGIEDVFDAEKANLSKMVDNDSYIGFAKHQANIEFSNEGVRASATTTHGQYGGGGLASFEYKWDVPIVKIDLTFDNPFMYLIRDKNTGEIWFAGMVYEPLKK